MECILLNFHKIYIEEKKMEKSFEFGGTSLYGFAGKQQIRINENILTIVKGGITNALTMQNGEKSYDISQITAIQVKKNGFMPGYMQISAKGNNDLLQGSFNALASENAVVIYNTNQYNSALEIKKYIEENRSNYKNKNYTIQQKSAAEQIKEFKELLDQEIITKQEFDEKKKQLLNN
jgi:hypothetical protein